MSNVKEYIENVLILITFLIGTNYIIFNEIRSLNIVLIFLNLQKNFLVNFGQGI